MSPKDNTAVAARQKALEHTTRAFLPARTYTLIRVDGRAFHTYTRKMERPFDRTMTQIMQDTMYALCQNIDGCVLGYTQSDEISLLMTDFATPTTQAWFSGNIQKITSISAALASVHFNRLAADFDHDGIPAEPALFDSRVWTIADPVQVAEYFRWRQQDCERNSVSMAAQSMFSHRDLQGASRAKMLDMMIEKGTNWNNYPAAFKRGSVCVRREKSEVVTYTDKRTGEECTTDEPVVRRYWQIEDAPIFTKDDLLSKVIPAMPTLDGDTLRSLAR